MIVVAGLMITGCASGAAAREAVASPTLDQAQTASPAATSTPLLTSTALPSATPTITPTVTPQLPGADLPLATVSYRLPLTVRHVTTDAVTLLFELNTPAAGSVYLRSDDGSPAIERSLDASQARHQLTFDGLTAGMGYQVVVALGDNAESAQQPTFLDRAWGPVSFHTPAGEGPLTFGVIGDASFGDPATAALIDEMAGSDLDFVLHTGDVVDETELGVDPFESYTHKFYEPFEPLLRQMPVYTAMGNHDYDADIRWQGEPFYAHAFPPFPDPRFPRQAEQTSNAHYAFAYQDVQFVVLDSQVFFGAPGYAEQDAWLRERLADPAYRTTIPVFHVSPFSSSSVHPTNSLPVREVWPPLFASAGVPLVFSGHYHQYERLESDGVTYIVTGGGSSITYAPGEMLPQSEVFARQTHYTRVEVDTERITISAVALGGDLLDRVEYPR